MLLRNLNTNDQASSTILTELNDGLPTIGAFARLCGRAISGEVKPIESVSEAANGLLALSQTRGMIEIRGNNTAFEFPERLLAICVEVEDDRVLVLRDKSNPRTTLKFLDAFRELCQSGLVLHHTQGDFSLSHRGFEVAEDLDILEYFSMFSFAVEMDH